MDKKGTYYMTLAISRVSPETPVILDAPDEIIQFFDGFFCEDNSFKDTWFKALPLEPGVYHCRVDFYFQQGYFEGYIAHGESDWEFIVTSAEQKIGFGKPITKENQTGKKGVRDPDAVCRDFDPSPQQLDDFAECDGDGHYLCKSCKWKTRVTGEKQSSI